MADPASPARGRTAAVAAGVLLMLAGLVLVLVGLAPVRQVFGLFGGAAPEAGFMDTLVADLKRGGTVAGIGFGLFLAGFITFKVARARRARPAPLPTHPSHAAPATPADPAAGMAPPDAAPAGAAPSASPWTAVPAVSVAAPATVAVLRAPAPAPVAVAAMRPSGVASAGPAMAIEVARPAVAGRPGATAQPAEATVDRGRAGVDLGGAGALPRLPSCPTCGGVLVAGGRFCGACGRVGGPAA